MVTHYDRGECDCWNCNRLCLTKDMVVVHWSQYPVCQKCAKNHIPEEKLDSLKKTLEF